MESLLKRSSIMCAGMIAFMVSSTAFTILSLIKSSFIRIETFLCAGGLTSRVCMFFFCSSFNVLICSSGIMVYPPFFIYYFYERINTSRLIDMVTYIFVFTEIYATVGKAVSLFQNPHVFRWQIAVCDYLPCFTASFREVGNKLFHYIPESPECWPALREAW